MRRWAMVLAAVALVATSTTGSPGAAQGQAPPERAADAARGLVYDGLVRRPDTCGTGYALATARNNLGRPVCTHGPDPAPAGVDVRFDGPASGPVPGGTAGAPATVPCYGDGTDGFRVQLLYVRASDRPDGYATWLPSFRQWAAQVDDVVNASAAETGGVRHVRFVHDAGCVPVVDNVVVTPSGDGNLDQMLSELRAKGYTRTDRKYLVWADANVYCGIGEVYFDDDPGQQNANNGHPLVEGTVARVDKACWGQTSVLIEAHELGHGLGAVQTSAPNATSLNHCTDEYDIMCYDDGGSGGPLRFLCPISHQNRFDCNHDDYFSTDPPAGSYLATHWNIADNRFLSSSGPPPPPTTTTSTTSSTTTSSTTTTTVPPTTTTTTPPPVIQGSTWFSNGSASLSGPAGSVVSAYATQTRPHTDYRLVTATGNCDTNVAAVNGNVRRSNSTGLIGVTAGPINRPAGTWQLCFRALDGSRISSPVSFTVT